MRRKLKRIFDIALELNIINIDGYDLVLVESKKQGLIDDEYDDDEVLDKIPFGRIYDWLWERSQRIGYRNALHEYMTKGWVHLDNVDKLKGTQFEKKLKQELNKDRYFPKQEDKRNNEFLLF